MITDSERYQSAMAAEPERRKASILKIATRLEKLGREMSLVAKQMRTEPIIPKAHPHQLGGAAGIVAEWVRELRRLAK